MWLVSPRRRGGNYHDALFWSVCHCREGTLAPSGRAWGRVDWSTKHWQVHDADLRLAYRGECERTNTMIRVLIVDDHAVVRSGLRRFLAGCEDLALVGEAESGAEAIRLAQSLCPDVVLMDLRMPGIDGVTATRELRAKCPTVRVIILTSFAEDGMVQSALQAGAMGYLLKNVTSTELANAIRAAFAGRITLSNEATAVLVRSITQPAAPVCELTARERDVLALMVEGLSNQGIADRLYLSLGTVKFHSGNIYAKLGVENRVAAVSMAIQLGLV